MPRSRPGTSPANSDQTAVPWNCAPATSLPGSSRTTASLNTKSCCAVTVTLLNAGFCVSKPVSRMPTRTPAPRWPLSDRGHRGAGVRVGILDTGFDTQNPAFSSVTVTAQHDFVFNDAVVRDEPGKDVAGAQFHGTAVWSLFAGDVPGRLRGIAPDATYLLAKTEDVRTETRVEEDNYVAALEWADSIGVDI